jgi:iron complex outermembrane recepter protein
MTNAVKLCLLLTNSVSNIFRNHNFITAIFSIFMLSIPAWLTAQGIEEIIVTATKRGETALQETPLSITALGSKTMTAMGIDDAADFLRSVPGLVFEEQGLGDKKYSLRGVQSVGAATTSVYFDDIVFTANNRQDGGGRNADPKMVDVERIEVLRGPQGTLYGASSMTGTIRFVSRKPNVEEYEGSANAQISTTKYGGESYNIDGVFNVPIIKDKLALRLVGYFRDETGWIDRPLINDKDVNNEDIKGMRAHLLWNASEALTLTGTFIHQDGSTDGRSAWGEEHRTNTLERYDHCSPKESCNAEITHSGNTDVWSAYNVTANYEADFGNFFVTTGLLDRVFIRSLDNTNIISLIRGVRLPDGSFDRFNPASRHMIRQTQDRSLWSNEARFSSSWDSPLQIIAGVFYQEEKNNFISNVGSSDSNGDWHDAAVRSNSLWREVYTEIDHIALFGDVSYAITDDLTATVGIRYFEFDVKETPKSVFGCCSGLIPGTGIGAAIESHDDGINMKYNLAYQVNDDIMVYGQAAEGFRAGGTNEPSILPLAICDGFVDYGSDSLWNYEVGIKSSWLDNRLTINVTPYYIDWSDIQIRTQVTECLSFFIQNAGKADVMGFEVEANWQPTDQLSLNVALGYADSKLTQDQPFQSGPLVDGLDGDEIAYTPDFTSKVGVEYTIPLSSWPADVMIRGDWSYTDSSATELRDTNPRLRIMPSYHLVDFRLGLVGHNGWRATLFVDNVFNEREDVSRYTATFDGDSVFTNRPREIGISFSKDFF